jgi:serine/threonine protein kinase
MAPEQSGRMNSAIGTGVDLYSLRVTLYQMITGELPFAAADAMEWILECHLAWRRHADDVKARALGGSTDHPIKEWAEM